LAPDTSSSCRTHSMAQHKAQQHKVQQDAHATVPQQTVQSTQGAKRQWEAASVANQSTHNEGSSACATSAPLPDELHAMPGCASSSACPSCTLAASDNFYLYTHLCGPQPHSKQHSPQQHLLERHSLEHTIVQRNTCSRVGSRQTHMFMPPACLYWTYFARTSFLVSTQSNVLSAGAHPCCLDPQPMCMPGL
jgi:hypothetical protein